MAPLSDIRTHIEQHIHQDENECVANLLALSKLDRAARERILKQSRELVIRSRESKDSRGTLDAFLQEFGLSNKEGIALMCLAESLLRIPDADTADKLIAEKVAVGDWQIHLGQSDSLFVNASTWGLMLTGKIIEPEKLSKDAPWYNSMISRLGEPVIRTAMLQAMRILGGQYVLGRTISEARKRGYKENRKGTRFSFDMLGEGARTAKDANKYFQAYSEAIHAIGKANKCAKDDDVNQADGISIKLSALHPRYSFSHKQRVMDELLPRINELVALAAEYNIGLNIDAEEANRLDISLDLFEALAEQAKQLRWHGLGFVLQAYQKRAPYVAKWLIALAQKNKQKFTVRLVKGAYWDSEIKHAQEYGLEDYPVFTRKANTDLSYQICAELLLNAQGYIYPQFATHNAYTIALIYEIGKNKHYEFQRLHGMGHLLYDQLVESVEDTPSIRVYAPVGAHKDLLPYLVRRLLENGANSSFVNRFMDESTPADALITDVFSTVSAYQPYRHPSIQTPEKIFQHSQQPRINAKGIDIDNGAEIIPLQKRLVDFGQHHYIGGAIVNGEKIKSQQAIHSPADGSLVGYSSEVGSEDIEQALASAHAAQAQWDKCPAEQRALILEKIADGIEQQQPEFMALICYEAGRTIADAISEIREAVDFCRYYAQLARQYFATPHMMPGPTGETNALSLHGRGIFLCVSPWNFPLAIFTGQIVAALASGNSVIAKPAEQTPLVASKTIELMHKAGIPKEVLHLLTGGRELGAQLVDDSRIAGIAFTGSTATAKHIQLQLAKKQGPIIPFIAETGGQNVMIVDSTALLEQVVDDVIASSFMSAGQRCSALRVLLIQEDIADNLIDMLKGACDEITIGQPWQLNTDVGPVIDKNAQQMLLTHIQRMQQEAKVIYKTENNRLPSTGTFVGPHIFELDKLGQLHGEVFGPILHVLRYSADKLDTVIDDVNAMGYGLTLGLHSRIESKADYIFSRAKVGNTYVNRNMVGAVVGVNPFGGQGLSGTGPKAGGPHYLFRFATEKTLTINTVATGGNAQLLSLEQ